MAKELSNFIKKHVLKKRFNGNSSNIKFWRIRGALHLYDELANYSLQDTDDVKIKVYNYLNKLTRLPICPICGNNITKFNKFSKGYNNFCSKSCLQLSPKTRNKREQTMLDRYGLKCNLEGDNTEKYMLKKYGVSNAAYLKNTESKKKNTKLHKYGDATYNNPDKNKKTRITNNTTHKTVGKKLATEYYEKNGTDIMYTARKAFLVKYDKNPSQIKEVQDKKRSNSIKKYGVPFQAKHLSKTSVELINNAAYLKTHSIKEISEETRYSISHISKYLAKYNITDSFRSSGEKDVYNFIKSQYTGDIIVNTRSVIKPLEIDIFVPEFKLCIEYNGSYWHSDTYVTTHNTKFKKCKDKGLYLLQIFDFQWNNITTNSILKSMIKNRLNLTTKIYARKCDIKLVSTKECNSFLDTNHLEGRCNSSIKYGLYYEGELVSLMTFGKSRFKKGEYELIRFVSKINTNVLGAASRLLKHFKRNNPNIKRLISFSDNLYFNGDLYKTLKFSYINESQGFFFVDKYCSKKVNRSFLQKHKLKKQGFKFLDKGLSGKEIVKRNGFFIINDACQTEWELLLKNI